MLGTFHNWIRILERALAARGQDLPAALAAAGIELPGPEAGRLPIELSRRIWQVAADAS
jgi:hypothetical protein